MFLVDAASWVIPQGVCQPPAISVTIFPQLLSPAWSPRSRAAPEHTMLLQQHPAASWGRGKHHGCGAAATLHPCPSAPSQDNVNALICVLNPYRHSSPAAQALPSWRNVTFNPARSFFELEQNWSANQAGSSFYKVHKVCFHQPYHTNELLFTYNNDWEAKFHAGQVKNPFSSVTGSSKPTQIRQSKTWVLFCWFNLWQQGSELNCPLRGITVMPMKCRDAAENILHLF